jgi:hypothetical protein
VRTFFGNAFLVVAMLLATVQVVAFRSNEQFSGGIAFFLVFLTIGCIYGALLTYHEEVPLIDRKLAGGAALVLCIGNIVFLALFAISGSDRTFWQYCVLTVYTGAFGAAGVAAARPKASQPKA